MREPGGDWQPVQGTAKDTLICLSLKVLPGRTQLALNPSNTYTQYINLVEKFKSKEDLSRTLLYTTDKGREVYVLTFRGGRADRPNEF